VERSTCRRWECSACGNERDIEERSAPVCGEERIIICVERSGVYDICEEKGCTFSVSG
jgi:hypothetical protein